MRRVGFATGGLELLDLLWLLLLCGYALGGVGALPFHADEAGHIHASRKVSMLIAEGDLEGLTRVADPTWEGFVPHDASLFLSIAPFHTYVMGGALYAAGLRTHDLGRGWDWEASYATNVWLGHRPAERWLYLGRLASTLFLCGSVVVLFALGRRLARDSALGGRPLAYTATALYATSPMVLLHGRRAMLEGPFLCFATLTLFVAAGIAQRRARGEDVGLGGWARLALVSGVCVATKHTGALFVAAAFAWVSLVGARPWRAARDVALELASCGVASVLVFVLLSPVLWRDPINGTLQMLSLRSHILNVQVAKYGERGQPLPRSERLAMLVRVPFLAELEAGEVDAEHEAYLESVWRGIPRPPLLRWLEAALTAAGGIALLAGFAGSRRGLVAWCLAVLVIALSSPLPWHRYLVPALPLAALLAGLGASALLRLARSALQADTR